MGTSRITRTNKNRPERVAELRRLIAEAQETLQLMDAFGEDDFTNGAVISFVKFFHTGQTGYRYAAVKANGLWYLTGRQADSYTWDRLVDWMVSGGGVEGLSLATGWEPIG